MVNNDTIDTELMAGIAKGNKNAMRKLVEKYKVRAYYLALGMVGDSDEAYDISQEAFIRVYKSARKFMPDRRFFPWFYAIIANLCRDAVRRREKHDAMNVNIEDSNFVVTADSNPEQSLIKKETARNLRKAIMKLDFEAREIIMLKHFRDLSYDDIASLLDIPRGTVMSRLYYARRKLADLVKEAEAL
jgi:RNA polymerase sigma-70 factor (ECF subfamily)